MQFWGRMDLITKIMIERQIEQSICNDTIISGRIYFPAFDAKEMFEFEAYIMKERLKKACERIEND